MSEIVNTLPYSVDLSKPLDKTDLHTLFVMGDNQAHRFELEIVSGSKAADLTGCTVTGYFTNFKEDTTIMVDGKVEGGKAVVTLSKPCYTLHGQFVLIIQIVSDGPETSVFQGEGYMRSSKGETIIHDDYIIYDVNTLLTKISAMETAIKNTNAATDQANAATTKANNAASAANTAASNANTKAQAAQTAADAANAAAQKWSNGTAANALQLNGKGAEFYATAEAVNQLSNEYTKVTIVSDEFDTEKNYNPGDYCISDNKLWRCRIASQGVVPSDDSSEWIQCNIAGEIQNYIVLNTYEFPNSSVVGGGSNMFDVTMNGYTPIAISYAMTNFVGCDIVGTRLYGNNVDLRFSQSQSGIIVRFGVLYKKS